MRVTRRVLWLLLPTLSSFGIMGCASKQTTSSSEEPASQEVAPAPSDALTVEESRETFETAWRSMRDAGAISDMSVEDWEQLRVRFESQAVEARTNAELRVVLTEMVDSLGKSHFAIIPREATNEPPPDAGGTGTLGIDARYVDDRATVVAIESGSTAEAAGIRPGWTIKSIRDFDMESFSKRFGDIESASMSGYHRNGALQSMLSTQPGQTVKLKMVDLEGNEHLAEVEGQELDMMSIKFGNLPPMSVMTESEILDQAALAELGVQVEDGYTVGLLRFNVWMVPIVQPIASAVDEFRTEEVDAVIIDLRGNPGGIGGLAMGVGGHFLDEPTNLGTMYNDFGELNFNTNPQRVSPRGELVDPLAVPLVVLVDSMSASTSEIFAGGMQDAKRAMIAGRRTPGLALPAVAEELPNGDILYHAIAEFQLPSGRAIEGIGVAPDLPVTLEPDSFAGSSDPDIQAAVEWASRNTHSTEAASSGE